ncbi:MAG: PT domain-containing protein, partial [Lachnospiraceae bacterium]|nr:PT domain-containing protein [Lachnospiraceae bacterium]
EPTIEPTNKPETPTTEPTAMPTFQPTIQPTIEPTIEPTTKPETPTTEPAIQPTAEPTTEPTVEPTSTSSPNADDKEVPITVKGEDRIRITEEKAEWVLEDKELKIFQNSVFNSNKIAPRVSGKYNFSVENLTNINYIYDFDFIAENNYGINLMYKLKRNGYYIVGNSSTWRDVQDLNVNNLLINANTNDVYTLIWKWVDSENDTRIGMEPNAGYKLTISFIYSQKEE